MPYVVAPVGGISSAVSPVIVFGSGATEILERIFRSTAARVGNLVFENAVLDEVVVKRLSPSESFTGDEAILIFTHGSPAIVNRVIAVLKECGCDELSREEMLLHIRRTCRMDAIQYEANLLLLSTPFPKGARMLCSAIAGTLSKFVSNAGASEFNSLAETASTCISLVEPRRIVICGIQNSGKSTLFNRLVMTERAIVSNVPGTTRDYIDEIILVDGFPFVLEDTAGIGTIRNHIDEMAQKKSVDRISTADIIICMIDGTNPETVELPSTPSGRSIPVWNKNDIVRCPDDSMVSICAKTGAGIEALHRAILDASGIDSTIDVSSAVIFTRRQLEIIRSPLSVTEKKEKLLSGH